MMPCCRKKNKGPFSAYRRQNSSAQTNPSQSSLKVLAAQTLKIASINGLGDAEKLETELENEIRWEENRRPPTEVIDRLRRRCEEILHSKPVLLFIVALNIIDCLLVMGELTLDFHHVSYSYIAQTHHTESFLEKLKNTTDFPPIEALSGVDDGDLTVFFNIMLEGFVVWNASHYTGATLAQDCGAIMAKYSPAQHNDGSNILTSIIAHGKRPPQTMGEMDKEKYDAEKIAHGMHYASISILTVLVIETLLKIACVGRRFLKKRMEVFDAIIIIISFTLDIIFVEGLSSLQIQKYVIILSFLLPWRVLRVLNSLIVAVMDQHRFHLKLLYKQKRKITRQYQEASEQVHTLEKQVEILKNLCSSRGVHDWELNKALGQPEKPNPGGRRKSILKTLTPNGHGGGLKALSKLVFQAAESFAPLSSPRLNKTSANTLSPDSASAPSLSFFKCNGDVEHGSSNGHAHSSAMTCPAWRTRPRLTSEGAKSGVTGVQNDVAAARKKKEEKEGNVTVEKVEGGDGEEEVEGSRTSDSETSSPRLRFYLSEASVDSGDTVTSPSDLEPGGKGQQVTRL